jgi:hypothetical protein
VKEDASGVIEGVASRWRRLQEIFLRGGKPLYESLLEETPNYCRSPPHDPRTLNASGPVGCTLKNTPASWRASSLRPAMQRAKTRSADRSGARALFGNRVASWARRSSERFGSPRFNASSASLRREVSTSREEGGLAGAGPGAGAGKERDGETGESATAGAGEATGAERTGGETSGTGTGEAAGTGTGAARRARARARARNEELRPSGSLAELSRLSFATRRPLPCPRPS